MDDVKLSKWLSYVLRHKPESAGLTLDAQGWVALSDVLSAAMRDKFPMVMPEDFQRIVDQSDKQRFIIEDGKIRANQGHSISVDLQLVKKVPPVILYHGTKRDFLPSIMKQGLIRGERHHVHLSPDIETALIVANRRKGESVILKVDSKQMFAKGYAFFESENGVWLTEEVHPTFLGINA